MLDHGKHILCEKPLCMNEKQTKKLIDHAKTKKLFCMEAIWSRFFPAYIYLREQVENGALGDIEDISVDFGILMESKDRIS
jgi:dihydrodiol dehydrogenase / D-xylose 1-dehydrogenase (NADP)